LSSLHDARARIAKADAMIDWIFFILFPPLLKYPVFFAGAFYDTVLNACTDEFRANGGQFLA